MRRLVLVLAVVLAPAAFAHSLTGPDSVEADAAGHFAYELTLVVDAATQLAWYEIDGSDGTDLGWAIFDGFCLATVEPGTYPIPIEGNLLDPAVAGTVVYEHYLCDGWDGGLTTAILPSSVAAEARTWGTVKSLYR